MAQIEGKFQNYGFSKEIPAGKTPGGVVDEIARKNGVRFVAAYVGDFRIFVASEHNRFEDLQEEANGPYFEAGLRTDYVTLTKASRVLAPKRGSPPYSAIVRARAMGDPSEILQRLDDRFEPRFNDDAPDHATFWYGAGVVTGAWQLVVDLGADVYEELVRTVREDLETVDGLVIKAEGYASLPGNAKRPGKPGS